MPAEGRVGGLGSCLQIGWEEGGFMILLPTARGEHIFLPLVPEDFVLCSVVLGLEPRT